MKLLCVGTVVLVIASLASLASGGRSGQLIEQDWARAAEVLPVKTMSELEQKTQIYALRVFQFLPPPFRQKLASKMWNVIELMTFRLLLVRHLAPALLIISFLGLLEGLWARSHQKALVKIHSPMRFSLALAGLCLSPILALLWVTAPLSVPATVLLTCVFVVAVFSTRNLIVHAPTQF